MTIADLINNHFWAIIWIYFFPIAFLGSAIHRCNKRITAQEKTFVIIDINQAKKFHFLMGFPLQTKEFMDDFCQYGFEGWYLSDWSPSFDRASFTIKLSVTRDKVERVGGMWFGKVQPILISRSLWEDFTPETVKKEISLKIQLLEQRGEGKTNDNS